MIPKNTEGLQKSSPKISDSVFLKGMQWLEAAKQETFSDETLKVWRVEMQRLGWTDAIFRDRITSVVRATTFGKVKFDDFMNAEPLYTPEEMARWVNTRDQKRIADIQKITFDESALEKEGLLSFAYVYARRHAEVMERVNASLEKRLKIVERYIKSAPEEIKLELREILENKGLTKPDEYWRQTLYLYAPNLIYEVEKIMKRL